MLSRSKHVSKSSEVYRNGSDHEINSSVDDSDDNGLKRIQNSSLVIQDDVEQQNFMQVTLNSMRKNKYFCDVALYVDNVEIYGHRVVLASASTYLFEMFTSCKTPLKYGKDNMLTYRLIGEQFKKQSLQLLVDYAYTCRIEIPFDEVRHVYVTAFHLKMDRVARKCAQHLVRYLTVENCIEVRSLPGICRNRKFVQKVDDFIVNNLEKILKSSKLLGGLPCVQIEILNQSKQEMNLLTPRSLCQSVLDWIRRQIDNEQELNTNTIFEQVYMLYLAVDNLLQDCNDLPPENQICESDLVQDYKKKSLKQRNQNRNLSSSLANSTSASNGRKKALNQPSRPRVLVYQNQNDNNQSNGNGNEDNVDIPTTRNNGSDYSSDEEKFQSDWSVIGSAKIAEYNFMALITINGKLSTLSIHLRLSTSHMNLKSSSPTRQDSTGSTTLKNNGNVTNGNGIVGNENNGYMIASVDDDDDDDQKPDLYCELAKMSSGRCGFGYATYQNFIIICGGYDRIECLKSVELYNPITNTWKPLVDMRGPRGRFQIAVIDDKIVYAVCGSNGTNELDSIEKFSFDDNKWTKVTKLQFPRSNLGVCTLQNKIYCIGGWNGEVGIKRCHIYDPETNECSDIASLNVGRYQVGVEAYNGRVYAVGGCISWNCLNSVEIYDPQTDKWSLTNPMLSGKRGCAVKGFRNKLYVIGGTDGSQSLRSTEIFDLLSEQWVIGPSLTTARANLGAAVVCDRLYVFGGFNGKHFVNTLEYLDLTTNEWTTFIPNMMSTE